MGVIITNVTLSKNPVKTNESFKISVSVRETINEPAMYRLPFGLGKPKGNIGNIEIGGVAE